MDLQTPEEILARALVADAEAHESARYDDIGERYDDVYGELLPIQDLGARKFAIAFHFWDAWIDARNHGWNYYPDIAPPDWPLFAREIAAALRDGVDPSNSTVVKLFSPENFPPLRKRLWTWLPGRRRSRAPTEE
ncbi:MAG: nitrite reductase small subunit [Actinomycetota bacterium]|jgi:hypothetical protein